ncbi:hypothetical protein RLOC_00002501 [Lonchura striata]|uniref:Secreted protein n=1 Tax=Lonchura striata TaxID=40157 RepID=A0A218UJS7_9PASE|nr:hypothetical protein RLOC_00002501 [Lonchura striata domestica]
MCRCHTHSLLFLLIMLIILTSTFSCCFRALHLKLLTECTGSTWGMQKALLRSEMASWMQWEMSTLSSQLWKWPDTTEMLATQSTSMNSNIDRVQWKVWYQSL